jgi:hypothetical protein
MTETELKMDMLNNATYSEASTPKNMEMVNRPHRSHSEGEEMAGRPHIAT